MQDEVLAARRRSSPPPAPGERVLDACASPGGKTTAMAAAMDDGASSSRPTFADGGSIFWRRTVAAAGAASVRVCRRTCRACCHSHPGFDCVLLDAPVLRSRDDPPRPGYPVAPVAGRLRPRSPMSRSRCSLELPRSLRPGGRLITPPARASPKRTRRSSTRFLDGHPDLSPRPSRHSSGRSTPFHHTSGYLRTFPFRDQLEPFFAAMLVKTKDLR